MTKEDFLEAQVLLIKQNRVAVGRLFSAVNSSEIGNIRRILSF